MFNMSYHILFFIAWTFGLFMWFKAIVLCWHNNLDTQAYQQATISFKISMLNKLFLQNHIVLSCSIFLTQSIYHAQPRWQAEQLVPTFWRASAFSTLMQYMSASHGYSTTGGIEYDDRGKYREDKKVRKSHIDTANQWAMEMPINWYQCEE